VTTYGIDLPPLRERFRPVDEGVEAIVSLLSQTTPPSPAVRQAHRRTV